MMGLGPMGSGAGGYSSSSSSSTSNLSALAPPFTVDRFNPKPNSNPMLHYSDSPSPYAVESFSHTWQYPIPSAPTHESAVNSTGLRSPPFSDDYQFSASATISPSTTPHWSAFAPNTEASNSAFGYGGDVKSYYSPYAPPLVGEDTLLVEDEMSHYNVVPTSGLNVTPSQIDYPRSMFDLECGPRWIDSLRLDDGKRAKRVDLDGSFSSERPNAGGSSSFKYQLNLGGSNTGTMKNPKEDSGISYQTFLSGREVHPGSLNARQLEDEERLERDLGFSIYDKNKVHIPGSYVLSEMHKNYSNYQNSSSPFEKCVDTPLSGSVSTIRSSPAVVIRPPPVTNGNLKKGVVSRKLDRKSDNLGGIQSVDISHSNTSKRKESGLKPSSVTQEEPFEANPFDFSKQGNGFISSSSVKELSSPLHYGEDTFDQKIKATFESQLPDIDVLGGFPMASDNVQQVVNSTEDSSDFVDHNNPAVDSPCWRGAPSSQFSQFDIETGNSNHVKKKLDEYYGFDHDEHQNLHSVVDSGRVFSEKAGEGAEISGDNPNMPRKESSPLNNLTSVFHMKVLDTTQQIGEEESGTSQNDVSEAGAVAVHAAEEVLASPAFQEDATEHHTILPDPKLDVPKIIKAMHNLSELLVLHLSSDTCSLKEENTETLKLTISNLSSCLSEKITRAANISEPKNHVGDTCEKLGLSRDVFTISGSANMANEAANSRAKLDSGQMHEEERNNSFYGKKDEKSPIISPLRDDIDIASDDDMAKAIKKVLDENFHLNEEMNSQALLFKSLWLDAEAKLCSITYKARFDRMKILMEETKLKAQRENGDIAHMLSKVSISPDAITVSEQTPKARDSPISKPSHTFAEGIENSVMARFNILKSREENNPKPMNIEKERKNEMVDGEHADPIMARFNVLKLREESSKSISSNIEEGQESKMVDGETEDETLNLSVKPYFLHRSGSLSEGKKLCSGYETLDEFQHSVRNDPIIDPFKNNRMVNQSNYGWPDSCSSSDWEHVMKDDFSVFEVAAKRGLK